MPDVPTGPAPVHARPRATPERRVAHHGDLICPQCQAASPPGTEFCPSCGGGMVSATVHNAGAWERHTRRPTAGPKGVAATGGRSRWRAAVALVGVIVFAGGLAASVRPDLRDRAIALVHPSSDRIDRPLALAPVGVTSEAPGHPVANVVDGVDASTWSAIPGDRTPVLQFDLPSPSSLTSLSVRIGDPAAFHATCRPRTLEVSWGSGRVRLALEDTPKPQTFPLGRTGGATGVTHLTVTVVDATPPSDVGPTVADLTVRALR